MIDGKSNPNHSLSSLLLKVIYERTMSEISTKYCGEESFPTENEGAQVACQLHPPQLVLSLSSERGLFTFKSICLYFSDQITIILLDSLNVKHFLIH